MSLTHAVDHQPLAGSHRPSSGSPATDVVPAAVATVEQASRLAQAMEAGSLFGQAQGLLMERYAIDADQAFAMLRRYSQDDNIKLRIVVADLVSTRRRPTSSAAASAVSG